MIQNASIHETGAATFLGKTVPAGISGEESLQKALDIIFAHPNVAPFISRQLIQRLVTSNPSPAYVGRVTAAFNNDGTGVKGNLKAVVKAVLLDSEARNMANTKTPKFGKVREPMLRFTAWARAFNATSTTDTWKIANTNNSGYALGQAPLSSPSVFNFYRPGYVPPNTTIAAAGLVAPEFQIVNESSVVGYVNFMQAVITNKATRAVGDLFADYSQLLALGDNIALIMDAINLVFTANQLSDATMLLIRNALASMPSGTLVARSNRIYAALTLVLAAPEYIVLK
jgi:uncharacterized protein (DUF1800 family)